MTASPESREQAISQALRQLAVDHQEGRLSLSSYRRLRRSLLEKADKNEDILPMEADNKRARPGIVVWLALLAIVLLLVTLGWLLR